MADYQRQAALSVMGGSNGHHHGMPAWMGSAAVRAAKAASSGRGGSARKYAGFNAKGKSPR